MESMSGGFLSGLRGLTLLQGLLSLVSTQRRTINDPCETVCDWVLPASNIVGGEKDQLILEPCDTIDVTDDKPCPDHTIPASHMHMTPPSAAGVQTVASSSGPQVSHCQQ